MTGKEKIRQYESDLEYFKTKRKQLLILALVLLGLGIILAVILGFAVGNSAYSSIAVTIPSLIISGAIVIFVLRSALYNRRIRNRKEAIRLEKSIQETLDRRVEEEKINKDKEED